MPTAVDLFAGGGGFTLGLKRTGWTVTTAVENFGAKIDTYRANFPDVPMLAQDIQYTVIKGPADLVVGGPPCEPYTSANRDRQPAPLDRLHKDKIGSLVLQFIRIVGDVRPLAFVMENVVQVAEGPLRPELQKFFAGRGFPDVHFNELRAEDAGAPSHRLRMFVSNLPLSLPPGKPLPPLAKVLAGLPPPGTPGIPNHEPHPLTPDKVERIGQLRPGDSLYTYRSATGKTHQNWIRLDADKPCPTVLGQSRFVHPTEPRLLTPREHARLMGYPDDFQLRGGRDQQYDAVGESVPPPLSAAIGRMVRDQLKTALPPA